MQQGSGYMSLWNRPTRKEIKRLEALVEEWRQRCAEQSRKIAQLQQQIADRQAAKDWALAVDALRAAGRTGYGSAGE